MYVPALRDSRREWENPIARYVVERELINLASLSTLDKETLEETLTRNETTIVALQDEVDHAVQCREASAATGAAARDPKPNSTFTRQFKIRVEHPE